MPIETLVSPPLKYHILVNSGPLNDKIKYHMSHPWSTKPIKVNNKFNLNRIMMANVMRIQIPNIRIMGVKITHFNHKLIIK